MAVELTEQEMQSPLMKYFNRDIARPVEELRAMVEGKIIKPEDALMPENVNDLLDDGYLAGEQGYCMFEDGRAMLANLLRMPSVTVEMFDWWFCWHVLEPIRYKIWDKNNHIYCLTKNPERILDSSIPIRERIWNTGCEIMETHLPGETPGHVVIPFRNPVDLGFDPERLKDFKGTIICSGDERTPVTMVHFVRPFESGIELRTRFWYGFHVVNGRIEKMELPPHVVFPEERLVNSLIHNINEFSNISVFLPELYEEYKDGGIK